jgi:hypothetical protein
MGCFSDIQRREEVQLIALLSKEFHCLTQSGFVQQYHLPDIDDSVFDNSIEYKGYLIWAEYPNGGMTAISIMHMELRQMFSFPCGVKGVEPFFDYHQEHDAISWCREVIDTAIALCKLYLAIIASLNKPL